MLTSVLKFNYYQVKIISVSDRIITDDDNSKLDIYKRDFNNKYKGSNWYHWRTRTQPIRTISEISAHIKILPIKQIPLYQKISIKAKQLKSLGMSYQQIASSLNIGETTVIRACKYKKYKCSF